MYHAEYVRSISVFILLMVIEIADWIRSGKLYREGVISSLVSGLLVTYSIYLAASRNMVYMKIFSMSVTYKIIPISGNAAEGLMFLAGFTHLALVFLPIVCVIVVAVSMFTNTVMLRKTIMLMLFGSTFIVGIAFTDIAMIIGSIVAYLFHKNKVKRMSEEGYILSLE